MENKIDTDLLKQMKDMENAKRKKALKVNKVNIVTGSNDSLVDFNTWWVDVNRRVKMHAWMKEIVKADFKGRGLKDKESIEKFDDMLRIFGIKF